MIDLFFIVSLLAMVAMLALLFAAVWNGIKARYRRVSFFLGTYAFLIVIIEASWIFEENIIGEDPSHSMWQLFFFGRLGLSSLANLLLGFGVFFLMRACRHSISHEANQTGIQPEISRPPCA